ncbi:exosome complex component CSL4 [Teleopsis dalmanni]|uniref:exosome complex component CSL4 n=1 Tax=Teleopsis dalmanni TaxID=139649 RepID=UPI0018CE1022|nr:exosome complex component CSL4 [Teleopsis dalmanni]
MAASNKNTQGALICLPGQRLCLSSETTVAGPGTFERQGYIYSTLAGIVKTKEKDNSTYIEVECAGKPLLVPVGGDLVTARVTLVNQRFARCSLLSVANHILDQPYRAILRKEDVRATEKDRVDMVKCYKPGDIILARVLPLTDLTCYQISTAENELGVVSAISDECRPYGELMVPYSWTEMQCPRTLIREPRKVAKVLSERFVKSEQD